MFSGGVEKGRIGNEWVNFDDPLSLPLTGYHMFTVLYYEYYKTIILKNFRTNSKT